MRHGFLCMLLVLGPPQVAAAEGAIGAAGPSVFAGVEAALEQADAPVITAAPGLDLRLDPARLSSSQPRSYGAPALESDWADPDVELDAADRGLSFGLEIKPRSRIGALARQDEPGNSGLDDQLQKLIERPVFGLRGRYRF